MQLGRKLGDVVERTLLCEVVKLLEGTVVFLRHEGQGTIVLRGGGVNDPLRTWGGRKKGKSTYIAWMADKN